MRTRNPIRCSNCNQAGHTKRKCTNPTTQRVCDGCLKEIPKEQNNRTCYGCQPIRMSRKLRGFPKHMQCGWCSELGHNIRTCPARHEREGIAMDPDKVASMLSDWKLKNSIESTVVDAAIKALQDAAARFRSL